MWKQFSMTSGFEVHVEKEGIKQKWNSIER